MEPYLHVRLCNPCRRDQMMNSDEIEDKSLRKFIPRTPKRPGQFQFCLRSDKERIESVYNDLAKVDGGLADEELPWANKQLHGAKLERYLQEEANSRAEELETSKGQRREEIKRRLGDAGWDELDWTFPQFVMRKWAHLVEGPKSMTDREPLSQISSLAHEQSRAPHRVVQIGEMGPLLASTASPVDRAQASKRLSRTVVTGERGVSSDSAANSEVVGDNDESEIGEVGEDQDGSANQDSEDEYCFRDYYGPGHALVDTNVTLRRPFPSVLDALALPIISDLFG
ncbi:hypothetical protein FRC08_009099 [Ceratobasidium sp. 394]|nr:hypothetical protein FRC08_009099 [Ceratobasidium sp. 394]